ncbi:MAG: hypothetical protein K8W52_43710 [Deltaproteobacteria bacterium]|nr:hypothetical protein [Deltaproteobacteria bacterium]
MVKVVMIVGGLLAVAGSEAAAAVVRVPDDAPTIQAAVDRANDGDIVRVAAGRWCGAAIDREVTLVGARGATIEGCASLTQFGGLRVGFLLEDARASGTVIRGFRFDGAGISTSNTAPLALAIIGRDAHGVVVAGNWIEGTVQAITNNGGDGWLVVGNVVHDLTIFGCLPGDARCGGGDGIVLEQRAAGADRAAANVVLFNDVSGVVPDGLALTGLAGIFVLGQDHPQVLWNRVSIPANPAATADAVGIQVTDTCCGDGTAYLTTERAVIVGNDGRGSPIAVEIDRDATGGTGNSVGALVRYNLGVVMIDGAIASALRTAARVIATEPRPFE